MEFKKYKYSDIGSIRSGKRLKKGYEVTAIKSSNKYIRVRDLNGNKINSNEVQYITDEATKGLQKYKVSKEDIIISVVGTVGLVAEVTNELDGAYLTENCNNLLIDSDICLKKYLKYYLESSIGIKEIKSHVVGSTQPKLPIYGINDFDILLPSLENQKKIVKILSDIDKKIEINEKIKQKLSNLGINKFNKWLSTCNDQKYIFEIADEILDYSKSDCIKVKLLNSSDVTKNNFPVVNEVDNIKLKGHFKKRFNKYDILYSQIRPRNMHYGYAHMSDNEKYIISTRYMVIRNKQGIISSSLLYFYLTSEDAIKDFIIKTESRSGTFPQGNYGDLSSFKVKYSLNQKDITSYLDDILEKYYALNKENDKLNELRDILMPKLLNGDIIL